MGKKIITGIASLLMMSAAVGAADVIPGRWERVEALAPGTELLVSLRGGERLEGVLARMGPGELTISDTAGRERILPRTAVLKIQTAAVVHDRLCNGSLIGSLAGAAAGVAAMIGFANAVTHGPVHWDEDGPAYLAAAALAGGGIGAATGALIDARFARHELLFRAQ